MKLVDNHTHSYFSEDSGMGIDDAIKTAQAKGLAGIVFTDHLDFDPPAGVKCFTFNVPAEQEAIRFSCDALSVATPRNCRQEEDFMVMSGVEIGIQMKSMEKIRKVMRENRFDTVIASLHLIDGFDPYYGEYYKTLDCRTAYGHYLEEFYNGIQVFEDFDILGHFDYIVRYAPYKETVMRYSEYGDIFDSVLKYLAKNGKTFEINTKTYQLYRDRHPGLDLAVLRRFRELGGEAISFGSDAHNVLRIGDKFEWCRECALAAGIRYEAVFRERKPHYMEL